MHERWIGLLAFKDKARMAVLLLCRVCVKLALPRPPRPAL